MPLRDLLVESSEVLGTADEPIVLTLTEGKGFVSQIERFNKRLARADTSDYKVVRKGDIAYNPYLLWTNAIAMNRRWDKAIVSPAYPVFRLTDQVDPSYVLHILGSPVSRAYFDKISVGSVPRRRRAPVEDFLKLRVPLPPLPEQHRIASILDRAEGLVQLRERSRHLVHELESRLFASFFRDELSDGANAATIPLGEIAQCSSGITKGRRTAEPTSPTPYMAVSNVQDRRLDLSVVKLIDATEVERHRFRLASGDLLLTEGGDPDKLGRGTVWRDEIEGAIHQNHIFRVRLTDENFLPDYLNWLLASDYGKSYFLSRAKQTTGIATINQTQLKAFPVIATKPERQRAFVRVLEAARASAGVAGRHATRLTDLMVGLQARAFRGEL